MTSFKISLSKINIEDISFSKYIKDFVFIVDEKRYKTSRIIEEILTTIIAKNDEKNKLTKFENLFFFFLSNIKMVKQQWKKIYNFFRKLFFIVGIKECCFFLL